MKCEKCGFENPETANFCGHCAHKLREVCNCWVFNKPHNCGQEKCPGMWLLYKKTLENGNNVSIKPKSEKDCEVENQAFKDLQEEVYKNIP